MQNQYHVVQFCSVTSMWKEDCFKIWGFTISWSENTVAQSFLCDIHKKIRGEGWNIPWNPKQGGDFLDRGNTFLVLLCPILMSDGNRKNLAWGRSTIWEITQRKGREQRGFSPGSEGKRSLFPASMYVFVLLASTLPLSPYLSLFFFLS